MAYNIAIDGPAGAGKSTIAKKVSANLGFVYVDTGAMYRAMAVYFLDNGIDTDNEEEVGKACNDVRIVIEYKDGAQQVILNGDNITGRLRTEEVGNTASKTAVYPEVRKKLVELQKILGDRINISLEKDMTPERRQEENEQSKLIILLAKQMINNGDLILRTEKLMAQSKTLTESVAYTLIK
jgi:cytidylate kinase